MSLNTFGHLFRVTTFGESHGPAIGCIVDGCPPNIPLTADHIQAFLDKRRPGQSRFTTQRQEPDQVRIMSGVFEDERTGGPVTTGTGEPHMKLFGFKGTRSNRVEWMLHEVGASYELVKVDLLTGAHKTPDHMGRHAHGLVPAFEDGDVRILASAAPPCPRSIWKHALVVAPVSRLARSLLSALASHSPR